MRERNVMKYRENERVYAIYSRKSKFTGKGESIGNQVEMCREYLTRRVSTEAAASAAVYEDEGFSGGTLQRPQFKKMMQDIEAGGICTVVCYRLDRISRNIGDFAGLIEKLHHLNVEFISIREQFDTESPMGRAMMYIASVFSQLERETIAERIRDNLHELAKTGRWLGGTTPTGYRSVGEETVTLDGKRRKAYHLQTIPEEAQLVKLIFAKLLELRSQTGVLTYLLNHGYKTKNGRKFTRFAIRGIVMNPVYAQADEKMYDYLTERGVNLFSGRSEFDGTHGVMAYNRTDQSGRTTRIKPMDEWVVSVGRHEGLVSGRDWTAVQSLLGDNKEKGGKWNKGGTNVALLSGLLYCKCGGYMRPKPLKSRTPEGDPRHIYMCMTKADSRKELCKNKNIGNGNLLDRAVCHELKKLSEDRSELRRRLKAGKKFFADENNRLAADLERLQREEQEAGKKMTALIDTLARAAGTPAEQRIIERVNELEQEARAIHESAEELKRALQAEELGTEGFALLREVLRSFDGTMDTISAGEKRAVIRTVVRRIEWDGEKLHLYLFGDGGEPSGNDIGDPSLDSAQRGAGGAAASRGFLTAKLCEDSK